MRNPAKPPAFRFLVLWTILARLDHSTFAFLMMPELPNMRRPQNQRLPFTTSLHLTSNNDKSPPGRPSSSGDPVSQGIVSALTAIVNTLSNTKQKSSNAQLLVPVAISTNNGTTTTTAPLNGDELLRRIEKDYTERNYLWTGDIDYACYDVNCCFSDPTLTFQGTATYARNIGNLRPIVDRFVTNGRSELLSIRLCNNDDPSSIPFVETRWNMVGELPQLPWQPRIDVIGNTKFWFHHENHHQNDTTTTTTTTEQHQSCQVYFYDEQWEIPPWQALLQLLTKAGTIPNSLSTN
jgi:Uncharacterized conserved protein (DUF2358)